MRAAAVILIFLAASAAGAQTNVTPTSEVADTPFLQSIPGPQVRVLVDGAQGGLFMAELAHFDVGGVFDTNAEQVPGISNADIVVLIRNNWQEAREVYNAGGLEIVGQQLPDAATYDPDTFVNVTNLTLPDGRPIRFYTFIRDVGGDLQYDGCMARLVLDDTYRGEANADFDSTVCSAQFN